jgi:hypothetical protein
MVQVMQMIWTIEKSNENRTFEIETADFRQFFS